MSHISYVELLANLEAQASSVKKKLNMSDNTLFRYVAKTLTSI